MTAPRLSPAQRAMTGRSLIEILVSLAIAAVILGAVLVTVSGTGVSGRKHDAQAQLSDEGQIALNMMTSDLRMAGFWEPATPVPSMDAQDMLMGCRTGFSNPSVANFGGLTCAGSGDHDAIAVRFQLSQPGVTPTDCLGNSAGIPADQIVDNRYYIQTNPQTGNPALYCRGNGGGVPQALVDNVEDMQVRYGVSDLAAGGGGQSIVFFESAYAGAAVRYLEADDLAACPGGVPVADSWCAVTSVRVCLLVRTADNAADQANTPFIDCEGNPVDDIGDRRIRRAMVATVSLRNRTAVYQAAAASAP